MDFFTRVLGMTETDRDRRAVYPRAWGGPSHQSVVVSEGAYPRVAHIAWRSAGAEALETAVGRLEQAGAAEGWSDPVLGHGRAFTYRSPGGHVHEIHQGCPCTAGIS